VADVAWCGLLTTWVDWSTVDTGGRAGVAWSAVDTEGGAEVDRSGQRTEGVCVPLSRCVSSTSNVGGGEPGSLSEKVGRQPSSPLRSAKMSSQAAGSRMRTGDPAEPWLIASAPWLYTAWASSQDGMSEGPSSCWASRHSRGGPGEGERGG